MISFSVGLLTGVGCMVAWAAVDGALYRRRMRKRFDAEVDRIYRENKRT